MWHVLREGRCIQGVRKKRDGKRPLGRHNRRQENIKIDFYKLGWASVKWIDLAQDRDRRRAFVKAVINFRVA